MPLYVLRTNLQQFRCDALILPKHYMTGKQKQQFQCRRLIPVSKQNQPLSACIHSALGTAWHFCCPSVAIGLCDPEWTVDALTEAVLSYPHYAGLRVYLIENTDAADNAGDTLEKYLAQRYDSLSRPKKTTSFFKQVQGVLGHHEWFEPDSALVSRLQQMSESFSDLLQRMIDEKGMTDAECYKKAGITKQHFHKIRSDAHYHPKKKTAIAFAIALELSLPDANRLLQSAGYTFSQSSRFDIIVEYHISRGIYDIYTINAVLYHYGEELIGTE